MKFEKKIRILNKIISGKRCFIVAEVSGNHAGKLSNLKKIINQLKNSDVDAIKIQAYQADSITINHTGKDFKIAKDNAWYKYKNLHGLYKKGQTPFSWIKEIFRFCKKNKIIVFASVFDLNSLKILEKLDCPAYKIASPEITDIYLIENVAKTRKPTIISTGLANDKDLDLAVTTYKKNKNSKLIILKCSSSYPAPIEEVNLETMVDIGKKYNCLTGYSDHTVGINVPIHAVSKGACVIEKHVCLKNVKAIDSFFAINTEEFKKMVTIIRNNERSNGKVTYKISKSSLPNLPGRKSIYVIRNIKKDEIFSEKNIKPIRPAYGMHPKYFRQILGKRSKSNLKFGQRMEWKHIIK